MSTVATIQTFRQQVHDRAGIAVHAADYVEKDLILDPVLRYFREARSGYTEAILTPIRQTSEFSTVDSIPIWQVDPARVVDSLRPGEKAFQLRVWQVEEVESSDVSSVLITASVEIQVHRRIAYPDEEYLYTSDEMLDGMGKLLDRSAWRALTSLDALLEGPIIDSVPEITNDILSYTVEFVAVVAPN